MKHLLCYIFCSIFLLKGSVMLAQSQQLPWIQQSVTMLEKELAAKYGEPQRASIAHGLKQIAAFWREEDGSARVFEEFVRQNYASDPASRNTLFGRFEMILEQLDGHMHEIGRIFRQQADLDLGPMLPIDEVFAGYDPSAHLSDDLFQNKIAFVALLNFPLTTLEQRVNEGAGWTRQEWAEARLADRFSKRIPANVSLALSQAASESGQYISEYNIWMHHIVGKDGSRLFQPKLRLLSHWNLRDELKADYADQKNGPAKQRAIQTIMERIVTQTIPQAVINNPTIDWNPVTNDVRFSTEKDYPESFKTPADATNTPEPNTRYAMLLKTFNASRLVDPYSPTAPTLIARRFDEDRELSEQRVKGMLEAIVSSPIAAKVGKLIEKRLGRPLEPFDIWYNGFQKRGAYSETQLDEIVSKRYPMAEAYRADIPNLLMKLGFSEERAEFLADHIVVDPARGSGHAMGAGMRSEKAHLRTRVEKSGMDYKGFNVAVHEMGHNVEQTFSLNMIDHTLLQGVPNTAFTEAIAFVFQGRDLQLLGLGAPDAQSEALNALNDYWMTFEIAGVALVDMEVWHWMYTNPAATPFQLNEAVVRIAKEIWNKYYAPIFGKKDVVLLGIYSHMIDSFMYLPDYPIGHMIAFQIEEQIRKGRSVGEEVERMTTQGRIAPDLWMKNATGSPVGPEAMIQAAEKALEKMKK